ncbi:MAG: basic secretory protein-like protein, partial [Planctomycetaceae bacterium]
QHAVQVSDAAGSLGRFRHLLFHVLAADPADRFGQTFFSEIDVVSGAADRLQRVELPEVRELTFATQNGEYHFTVDTTAAQELESWTDQQLRPVILEWYPKIVQLLPGPGFQAPRKVRFRYQPDAEMRGIPAYASGNMITLNVEWFRGQLQKEARGCVVHELVHVVQQYSGGGRGPGPRAAAPGWLVEGIPDYIRWFLYEPESGGARLSADRLRTAQHDASYRVSANFLDWVIRSQPAESKILEKLNVALRAGRYTPELWQQLTGRTEQQLAESWRQQSEN